MRRFIDRPWAAAARLVAILLVLLMGNTPSGGAAAQDDGVFAYVDQTIPPHLPLAEIAKIEGENRSDVGDRLTKAPVVLLKGDTITITRPDGVVIVRQLLTNAVTAVTFEMTKKNPYPVSRNGASGFGLGWVPARWFIGVLQGANQTGDTIAASRGIPDGPCYNQTGRTNQPTVFEVPILASDRSLLLAGRREVFVAWRGGAPPFKVTLADAATNGVRAQRVDVRRTCAVYLPGVELNPGRYRLTVTDANNVDVQEDNLFVVAEAPAEPRELHDADLPAESHRLFTATWLGLWDHGRWAFEAQQRVASMDCRSASVQDWLRQWGRSTSCVDAIR
jgi:hypothetical protein